MRRGTEGIHLIRDCPTGSQEADHARHSLTVLGLAWPKTTSVVMTLSAQSCAQKCPGAQKVLTAGPWSCWGTAGGLLWESEHLPHFSGKTSVSGYESLGSAPVFECVQSRGEPSGSREGSGIGSKSCHGPLPLPRFTQSQPPLP